MKKSILLPGIAVVVVLGLTVRLSTRDAVVGQVRSSERFATTRISEEFEIAAGSVQSVLFAAPAIAGTLSGQWKSSGKGGNDALSGFTLTDPSDALLDASFKGSSGSFEVKVSAAGTHTFFFENAGVKQTPRRVLLDAEFTPD
jgi:hypothetical protein